MEATPRILESAVSCPMAFLAINIIDVYSICDMRDGRVIVAGVYPNGKAALSNTLEVINVCLYQ